MRTSLYDYCREHDLNDLLRQWHPSKNGPLTPKTVTYGSKRRVWWRCEHGHEWQAAVYTRTGAGTGCPVCGGKRPCPGENDLATACPELALEWDEEKNAPLTPHDVFPGSGRRVWWRCAEGHVWRAVIFTRARGRFAGCPVCAGRAGESGGRVGTESRERQIHS